ncbi:hypothetical protein GCM10010363_44510 [Streptomyces omiyaensis]|nr:hypothetical protein GCM10010363_44510 [Streptomyces omiyaensis]
MPRAGDLSPYGPCPSGLFDPVPEADLRAAIVAGVPGPLDDPDGDTRPAHPGPDPHHPAHRPDPVRGRGRRRAASGAARGAPSGARGGPGPVPGGGVRLPDRRTVRGAGPRGVCRRGDQEGLSGLKLPVGFS